MNITDNRKIYKKSSHDVIVVGGGIAGVSAAVSAARHGADVLLIEKSILLGGLATIGLISWFEPLCDSCGKQMIGGISEELIRLAIKYGFDNMPESWKNKADIKQGRYTTFFSPTIFSLALDEYTVSQGVTLLFDCLAVMPVIHEGICEGIIAETKEGKVFYPCKMIIDATGDASVFAAGGAPTECGDNFTTIFSQAITAEGINEYTENRDMRSLRKWLCLGSNLAGKGHPEGMRKICGLTAEDITEYVLTGRRLLFEKIKESDRNSRDIATLPMMPQLRTIRHITGEYSFKARNGEAFENAVGSCGDFRAAFKGNHYQIPYTALYNKNYKNMIAAGRIISAEDNGWEVSRVIPVCGLTGQAAGTAAALCIQKNTAVDEIDVSYLQKTLASDGVIFEI